MERWIEAPERPRRRDALDYVAEARAGALLRGRDGLDIRLAAPERESSVRRERLSLLGVLLALVASGVGRR
ncbi:MAG TPA: hypothetical protein VFQ55_11665 [Casimicrobiaceae bacterium]|jgi:hypothetical protein|nr:hypothetical protein [Casimicrobiaceae bacterium]